MESNPNLLSKKFASVVQALDAGVPARELAFRGRRYKNIEEAQWDGVPDVDIPYVVDGLNATERAQYSPLITIESGPFKGRQYRRDPITKSLVRV